MFLKVTSRFQVVATTNIEESSDFFISYNEDGRSAYEFSIHHLPSSPLLERDVKPISHYLYAPVDYRGRNNGPLTLRLDARDRHTAMTLHSRRIGHFDPVDTKDWLSSRDIFYIRCKRRIIGRNSFICVKRGRTEFITCCVPTIRHHDESREKYMLFRLLRSSKRKVSENKGGSSENEPLGIRATLRRVSSSGLHLPFGFKFPSFQLGGSTSRDSGNVRRGGNTERENIELAEVVGETEM